MKLVEALEIAHRPAPADRTPFSVSLACGFATLHLGTFLRAELIDRLGGAPVEVRSGTFDDLPGNVDGAGADDADVIVVCIEWGDVDPRLGVRRLGGWAIDDLPDILTEAEVRLTQLATMVTQAARSRRVVCSLPNLPLPPLFPQPTAESGSQELDLGAILAEFAAGLARNSRLTLLNQASMDVASPPAQRRDLQAELHSGFPYTVAHASILAAQLAGLIVAAPRKKGLITDLDGTLWAGVLDEVGATGVTWDLDSGAHRHGLYQQMLASLSSAGVLIAVASRNDPELAGAALARGDLLISSEALHPQEVGWGPKSASVSRILHHWNVAADAVVFVDDSAMELDEVRDSLPGITTVRWPGDDDGLLPFLTELRGWFGTSVVSAEDRLRAPSIRAASGFVDDARQANRHDTFLAGVDGVVVFSSGPTQSVRAIELLNKTNQFRLNRRVWTEGALTEALRDGAHLVTTAYEDKYGPLGTVSAAVVRLAQDGVRVEAWALSCRAFSRRIEHHTMHYLFDSFNAVTISLGYEVTERNTALRAFLRALFGEAPAGPVQLDRSRFEAATPALVHRVVEVTS